MTWTHITDTTLSVSLLKSVSSVHVFLFFYFADDLPLALIKGNKLTNCIQFPCTAPKHSDCCDALCVQMHWYYRICHISSWLHVQTIQLIAIGLLNISGAHSVCYEYVLEKCLPIWMCRALNSLEPNDHQYLFSSLSFLCENASSVLLGDGLGTWYQLVHRYQPAYPPNAFFHFLKITEG